MTQHLSLEQILEVRDGATAPEFENHLAGCGPCAAELDRLRALAVAMKSLPLATPSRDGWPAIRAAAVAQRRRRKMSAAGGVVLALAASVVLFIVAPRNVPTTEPLSFGRPGANVAAGEGLAGDEVAGLMRESRRLEETLRAMGPEGRVQNLRVAGRVADIEDQISVIDARLAVPGASDRWNAQEAALWKERVGLMNALVRAHDTRPAYVGL
jgi:hypothetical protein